MSYRYRYPALSPNGQYVASGARDLDVVGIRRGTGWQPKWLDDDRVIVNGGDRTRIVYRDGRDDAPIDPNGSDGRLIAYQEISADAGRWVGCTPGYRLRLPAGGVLEGRYFQPCFYASRLAVLLEDPQQVMTLQVNGHAVVRGKLTQPSLSQTQVCWRQGFGQGWRTLIANLDGTDPRDITIGAVEHWSVLVETPAGDLVLSHDGARTYLRRPGETRGWLISTGECFEPQARWTGDGLRCVWMAHGALAEATIRPSDATVDLTPIVVPTPIVAIGRPLRAAFFEFVPADLPGNAELTQVSTSEWRVMAGGRHVGTYVSGEPDGDLDALDRKIALVKGQGVPVYAYWTRKAQEQRLPRHADVIAVEAYRLKEESLLAFETRVRASVRRCGRAALVCQCYTSNATLTTDLASLVPVYARIAHDMPTVEALLIFSGSGRATGWQDHPEVHAAWRELLAGIHEPALPAPTVRIPGVDVVEWQPIDADKTGPLITLRDRNNAASGTVEVFLRDGSIHAKWSNAAGSNTTGALRKVI